LLFARLTNVVALIYLAAAAAGPVPNVDAVSNNRVTGIHNIDATCSLQHASGDIYGRCVVFSDGRVIRCNRVLLFACCGDLIHLAVTQLLFVMGCFGLVLAIGCAANQNRSGNEGANELIHL
jgi:hypothetical protein